ncbi:hypothetical protein AGMMS50276_06010 [Synergistales bacterium]|nr:hypothetical protein AGMMS50276_06010 [Synergistales bacterium]
MTKLYVLDACALIAYLNRENGGALVRSIFIEAAKGNSIIRMNKLNLLEVYYDNYRARGKEAANVMLEVIRGLPITIISEITDSWIR